MQASSLNETVAYTPAPFTQPPTPQFNKWFTSAEGREDSLQWNRLCRITIENATRGKGRQHVRMGYCYPSWFIICAPCRR